MKNIIPTLLTAILFALMATACVGPQPIIVGSPGNADPAGDAYKQVLLKNESPFWVRIYFRDFTVTMKPGSEIITRAPSPPFPGRQFGGFSFMGYAYRQFDGKRLSEFVGEQEFYFYLNAYPIQHNRRTFGAVVWMSGFSVSPYGYPVRFSGTFLNIVPWNAHIH